MHILHGYYMFRRADPNMIFDTHGFVRLELNQPTVCMFGKRIAVVHLLITRNVYGTNGCLRVLKAKFTTEIFEVIDKHFYLLMLMKKAFPPQIWWNTPLYWCCKFCGWFLLTHLKEHMTKRSKERDKRTNCCHRISQGINKLCSYYDTKLIRQIHIYSIVDVCVVSMYNFGCRSWKQT